MVQIKVAFQLELQLVLIVLLLGDSEVLPHPCSCFRCLHLNDPPLGDDAWSLAGIEPHPSSQVGLHNQGPLRTARLVVDCQRRWVLADADQPKQAGNACTEAVRRSNCVSSEVDHTDSIPVNLEFNSELWKDEVSAVLLDKDFELGTPLLERANRRLQKLMEHRGGVHSCLRCEGELVGIRVHVHLLVELVTPRKCIVPECLDLVSPRPHEQLDDTKLHCNLFTLSLNLDQTGTANLGGVLQPHSSPSHQWSVQLA